MVLTPQMAISHLVMTIGVGISQKKNIKNFDDVQILWNDPYIFGPGTIENQKIHRGISDLGLQAAF